MPDGRIFSLPIPQKEKSPNRYKNLQFDEFNGAELLKSFKSKIKPNDFCHYDPRLNQKIGIFGQANAAQSELDNLEVQTGDLFLFFGWFRNADMKGTDLHHLFGWLQIDEIIKGEKDIKNYLKLKLLFKYPFRFKWGLLILIMVIVIFLIVLKKLNYSKVYLSFRKKRT